MRPRTLPEIEALTTASLRELADSLGLAGFGVTDTATFEDARERLVANRAKGMAGPVRFTYGDPELATEVRQSFPWARSLIVVAHSYLDASPTPADGRPQIGRFATSDHYQALGSATSEISDAIAGFGYQTATVIDDNRLVDRAAAARSGVGWIGKSTMVLIPGHGPWTLLGSVVTDAPLQPTEPMSRGCGTCVACIPACPTGAITSDGLDARRCISAWLQAPGPMPHWIRPHVGTRIYGCDDCLTSCPPGHPALTQVTVPPSRVDFPTLLDLDDDALRARFNWWYIPDRDARFVRRNIVVGAGNSGDLDVAEPIRRQFEHRSSLVRGHAYWAYARLRGLESWATLDEVYRTEKFPDAVYELERAMLMLRAPG